MLSFSMIFFHNYFFGFQRNICMYVVFAWRRKHWNRKKGEHQNEILILSVYQYDNGGCYRILYLLSIEIHNLHTTIIYFTSRVNSYHIYKVETDYTLLYTNRPDKEYRIIQNYEFTSFVCKYTLSKVWYKNTKALKYTE